MTANDMFSLSLRVDADVQKECVRTRQHVSVKSLMVTERNPLPVPHLHERSQPWMLAQKYAQIERLKCPSMEIFIGRFPFSSFPRTLP